MLIFLCQLFYFSVYRIVTLWYNVYVYQEDSICIFMFLTQRMELILLSMKAIVTKATKSLKTDVLNLLAILKTLSSFYEDPVAHFKQVAKDRNSEKKNDTAATISINMNEKMSVETDDIKNVGYLVLKHIYKELEIDKFWKQVSKIMNLNMI